MPLPSVRFTIGRIMAVTAVGALVLASFQEKARFAVGCVTVAASVVLLTCKLSVDRLGLIRASGREPDRHERRAAVSSSAADAVAVLVVSDVTFLIVYWIYMGLAMGGWAHSRPWEEPFHIVVGALIAGAVATQVGSRTVRALSLRPPDVTGRPTSPAPGDVVGSDAAAGE